MSGSGSAKTDRRSFLRRVTAAAAVGVASREVRADRVTDRDLRGQGGIGVASEDRDRSVHVGF